MAGFATFGY